MEIKTAKKNLLGTMSDGVNRSMPVSFGPEPSSTVIRQLKFILSLLTHEDWISVLQGMLFLKLYGRFSIGIRHMRCGRQPPE